MAATTTLLLAMAPAANAVDSTVGDFAALQSALSNSCADSPTVTLGADIPSTASPLNVSCSNATLNLNGFDLTIRNVVINTGLNFTITDTSTGTPGLLTANASRIDSTAGIGNTGATLTVNGAATVTAIGSLYGAGIGGGYEGVGGTTTIGGTATVTATGGSRGAGIGGGISRAGGTTTIGGTATVTATGGDSGAGIGGGLYSAGGTTTIGGTATVTATGGDSGAGIGGGIYGAGGTTNINESSIVTATGGTGSSAVGGGSSRPGVGSLTVNGTLSVPSGILVIPTPTTGSFGVTVGATGRIIGTRGAPTVGAQIQGAGQIDNNGSITLSAGRVTGGSPTPTKVYGHYYVVSFDTEDGSTNPADETVFAQSFDDGSRAFPDDPTKLGSTFLGWNTASDGSGTTLTTAGMLPGVSSDGGPVVVTVYAQWDTPLKVGVVPVFSAATSTDTGFTSTITNYDAATSYSATATNGATVVLNGSTLVVSKLAAGGSATVTLTTMKTGFTTVSAQLAGAALPAPAPRNAVLSNDVSNVGSNTSVATPPATSSIEPGVGKVLIGDKSVASTLTSSPTGRTLTSGSLSMTVSSDGDQPTMKSLTVETNTPFRVSIAGFQATSEVGVWVFSTPVRVADAMVDSNQSAQVSFVLPSSIKPGNHTLVATGTSTSGDEVTMKIGFVVIASGSVVADGAVAQPTATPADQSFSWSWGWLVALASLVVLMALFFILFRRRHGDD